MIDGLTEAQSRFVETYLAVPKVSVDKKKIRAKRQKAIKEFADYNVQHDAIESAVLKLSDPVLKEKILAILARGESIIEKDGENLDFQGGQALLDKLDALLQTASVKQVATEKYEKSAADFAEIEKQIQALEAAGKAIPSDKKADLDQVWDFVQNKYASGMASGSAADLDSAIKAMGSMTGLLAAAKTISPFEMSDTDLEAALANAPESLKQNVNKARFDLTEVTYALITLKEQVAREFTVVNIPDTLQARIDTVDARLDTASDAGIDTLVACAAAAKTAMAAAQAAADIEISAHAGWETDHDRFLRVYDILEKHAHIDETSHVNPMFMPLKTAYDAVIEKANSHKYIAASTDIAPLLARANTVLDFADSYARFDDIYDSRVAMVATLPTSSGTQVIQDAIATAIQLQTDAESERDASDMGAAVTKLDLIPAAVGVASTLIKQASTFERVLKQTNTAIDSFRSTPATIEQLVDKDIDLLERAVLDAQALADAGKISSGTQTLAPLTGKIGEIRRRIATIKDLQIQEAAFDTRLEQTQALKGGNGRVAIEPYYQRLKDDRTRINVLNDTGEYARALATAIATKDMHAGKIALATVAGNYLNDLNELNLKISRLQADTADEVEDMAAIGSAQTIIAQAETATQNEDWAGGLKLLKNAASELDIGLKAFAFAENLDDVLDINALNNVADDFDAAIVVFSTIHALVSELDTTNSFTSELDKAREQAEIGREFLPSDPMAARTALEAGIDTCKSVSVLISDHEKFQNSANAAEDLIGGLSALNDDNCIKPEIDAISAHINKAMALAKANDFKSGLSELAAVNVIFLTATTTADFFAKTFQPAQNKLNDIQKSIAGLAPASEMADKITQINSAMAAAWANRDFTTVEAKADQGLALRDEISQTATSFKLTEHLYKTWFTDTGMTKLDHPAIPNKQAQIKSIIQSVDSLIANRTYETAREEILHGKIVVSQIERAIKDHDLWTPIRDEAEIAIKALLPRDAPEIGSGHDRIAELKALFDLAVKDAEQENFGMGQKKLIGFVEACDKAEDLVINYERYGLARVKAQTVFESVSRQDTTAITSQFARLEGKRNAALDKAAAFDFEAAIALFDELISDCATVKVTVDAVGSFDEIMADVKDIEDDNHADMLRALSAAEMAVKTLRDRPTALYIKAPLDELAVMLERATNTTENDFDETRALVGDIVKRCSTLMVALGELDQLNDAAVLVRNLADTLSGHDQYGVERTAIEAEIAKVDTAMLATRRDFTTRDTSAALIEDTITRLRAMDGQLGRHKDFATKRDQTQKTLKNQLENNSDRHAAKEEIAAARDALNAAILQAGGRDYTKAMAELKKADGFVQTGLLRIQLATNDVPSTEDIKDLLAQKDGQEQLDKIINDLDPAEQRKVAAEVFKAKFDCDLEMSDTQWGLNQDGKPVAMETTDTDAEAPNLVRFVDTMSDLPPASTLDTDSMVAFSSIENDDNASFYDVKDRQSATKEGEAKTTAPYSVDQKAELGEVDPDATLEEAEPITQFNWNTLREVAQTMDKNLGFMRGHDGESNDTYGGWTSYLQNVTPIADAIADKYDFDRKYIAEYIKRGKGSEPEKPDAKDCDAMEWGRRRVACQIWVDRARSTENPWETKSTADNCTIGDRVYHESQPGEWVSYLASARRKGVTNHQFRAPGEWFSELYAAFHSKMLKPSHPAYAWLSEL